MSLVKNDNYVNIQGWMISELNLCGNSLIVYAIIYGFSQDGNSSFTGSLQYLADWCNATKQGVQKNLKELIDKGLITKKEYTKNNQKFCEYSCIPYNKVVYTMQQSCINNIENNIENIGISKEIPAEQDIVATKMTQQEEFDSHMYSKEDMKSEFLGSASKVAKTKGNSLYSKCSAEINAYTQNAELTDALHRYLTLRLQMKDKPIRGVNQWKGMLKKLDEFGADALKVVEQSIERGWASFYSISAKKGNNFMENDISVGYGIIHPGAESTPKDKRGGKEF